MSIFGGIGAIIRGEENPTVQYTPPIDEKGFITYDFNAIGGDQALYMCEQLAFLSIGYIKESGIQEILKTKKLTLKVVREGESPTKYKVGYWVDERVLDIPTRQALFGTLYGQEDSVVFPNYDNDVALDDKRSLHWVAGKYEWKLTANGWVPRRFKRFNPEDSKHYIETEDRLRQFLGLEGFKEDEVKKQGKNRAQKKPSTTPTKQETPEEKQLREACAKEVKEAGSSDKAQIAVDEDMRELVVIVKRLMRYGDAIREQYDSTSGVGKPSEILNRLAPIIYPDDQDHNALTSAGRKIDQMCSDRLKKQAEAEKRAKTSAKPAAEQKKSTQKKSAQPTQKPQDTGDNDPYINLKSSYDIVDKSESLSQQEKLIVLGLISRHINNGTERLKLSVLRRKIKEAGVDRDIIAPTKK